MIRRLLPALVLLMLCLFAAPRPAMAFDFFQGADCSNNASATVCQTQAKQSAKGNSDPLTGPNGLLIRITNIIAFVAGAAAVIVILVSALRFITSGSDVSTGSRTDTDVEDARRSIAGAVIGLIVILLARTLILYIIKRL